MTLRLFLLSPAVIFAAQINGDPFGGDVSEPIDQVTFDNVTTGAYTAIRDGMTVLFGLTPGADDMGRQRVRADASGVVATTTTVNIGRSSFGLNDGEMAARNDNYITVLDDYRVWAKPSNIVIDTSTSPPTSTIYKDSLLVGDNTSNIPPKANIGPGWGHAATIDSGTSLITVTFDGTDSEARAAGATISSYLWDVGDGTITVGTSASSGIVATFPAGFRWVSLTVTDSNGKTHIMRVPVFARDPAADACVSSFEIVNRRITPEGQQYSFRITEDIDEDTYPDGTLVMYWDGEPASSGDRTHMLFAGWHHNDPAEIRATQQATLAGVTLECLDVAGKLDTLPGFTQELAAASSPAAWTEMANPNMGLYLDYLLRWHSTALELAYWQIPDFSAYSFRILGSDGESLWDQVQRRARALVPDYWMTCTRHGQLQTVVDQMLLDLGDRTNTVQVTLTAGDWQSIGYAHQRPPRVHWLWSNAILALSAGATGGLNILPLFSKAPGSTPGQGLQADDHGEQLALSQAGLNSCEGHRYYRRNAPQTFFNIVLTGSSLINYEPADLTWVQLNTGGYGAQRGLEFTNERGLVHEINVAYEHRREATLRTITLLWERQVVGVAASTHIPPEPDEPPEDPWPDPAPEDPPPGLWHGQNNIFGPNTDGYFYYTLVFQTPGASGGPTWARINMGLTGTIYSYSVDPFSPLYIGTGSTVNGWIATSTDIYYFDFAFSTATLNIASVQTFGTATPAVGRREIWASFGIWGGVTLESIVGVISYYKDQAGHTGTWSITSDDGGTTWGSEVQITSHYSTSAGAVRPFVHVSSRYEGKLYAPAFLTTGNPATSDGYISVDKGVTWSRLSSPNILPGDFPLAGINVPWLDNEDELLVYHGAADASAGANAYSTKRVSGSAVTDISPTAGGNTFGPRNNHWSIVTYDPDPNYLAMVGRDEASPDNRAAFVSSTRGDDWTVIVAPTATGPIPDGIAFAGDTPQTLFLWGSDGYISYSQDGGNTIDDRRGNIPDDFPSIGIFIGISGG